jgi:hypothetical protein
MEDRRHGESESRIASSLRDIFRRGGWKVERELRPPRAKYAPDLIVSKGDVRFVVELKMVSEARRDRLIPLFGLGALQARKQALEVQASEPQSGVAHPLVVIVSPRMTESIVQHLEELAVDLAPDVAFGAVSLDGFRYFSHPALSALNERAESKPRLAVVAPHSMNWFSDLNQWMLKVLLAPLVPERLLAAPRGQYRNVSELAKAADVSVMSAFRFARQLQAGNFLENDADRIRLVRIEELMERWQAANQRPGREYPARWILGAGRADRLVAAVREYVHEAGEPKRKGASPKLPRLCLGLFAAAERLGLGFVHGASPHMYVESPDHGVLRQLGLALAQHGEPADVMIRFAPRSGSIFRGAVQVDGVPAADVIQVWLDVQNHPARGRQQADEIRRRVLLPLFSEVGR